MSRRNQALDLLETKLRTILPEQYQDSYEEVQPVSMGSAGLRFDAEGRVAWDEMWKTFCDLAMAGGPPHKGTLLEPGSRASIEGQPDRYAAVVDEVCRGIRMVTGLQALPCADAGWVRVTCSTATMAGWLLRAIVMENISARAAGRSLDLPAGPDYRVEKEIKNVVTVIAKTCHYWMGHTWTGQKRAIAELFKTMAQERPLVVPAEPTGLPPADGERLAARISETVARQTGLLRSPHRYVNWLGVDCQSVGLAVWMMRIIVVSNVLSRREGTTLFVPINPKQDPDGATAADAFVYAHRLARANGVT